MTNHPGLPGLRGFLEGGTYGVKTKKVLGNQDELITLDTNQQFCGPNRHLQGDQKGG